MAVNQSWEELYKKNQQMSIWPWSELISYVMRYAVPKGDVFHVLEVGCGAGANIPFFQSLGNVDYYAIEGSTFMVETLQKRFPQYAENIVAGDFTKQIPFLKKFDLIVDRSSITHNSEKDIENCLSLIYDRLKVNGIFIGIDWFDIDHSDAKGGHRQNDDYTFNEYKNGQFADVGNVHFTNTLELQRLLKPFEVLMMEKKMVTTYIPERGYTKAAWNFVAKK